MFAARVDDTLWTGQCWRLPAAISALVADWTRTCLPVAAWARTSAHCCLDSNFCPLLPGLELLPVAASLAVFGGPAVRSPTRVALRCTLLVARRNILSYTHPTHLTPVLYLVVGNRRLTRPNRSDTISLPSGSNGWLMGVNIVRVHVMNKQLKFIVLVLGSQARLTCTTFKVRQSPVKAQTRG